MKRSSIILMLSLLAYTLQSPAQVFDKDLINTSEGSVEITFAGHGLLVLL